jgi:hypothetical protein
MTPVITVSSRHPKEPYYHFNKFLASLNRFGVDPIVLGMNQPWQGLMTKAFLYRDWLRSGDNKDIPRIILCDAWDIVFAEKPDAIGKLCEHVYGDAVVFNGEKACWPRADLADTFPDQGPGAPWRYLNCGFICGPAASILTMLEAMNLESIGVDRVENGKKIEPNDQGEFQALFSKQPVKMVVDAQCIVAQTLSACTLEEFDLSGPEPNVIVNKVTHTIPGVFHGNGDAKNLLMPAFYQKLGL